VGGGGVDAAGGGDAVVAGDVGRLGKESLLQWLLRTIPGRLTTCSAKTGDGGSRVDGHALKTICFSKKILMHDIIIGLFINRYEFACVNTA
jgi:hypothetical protein